MLRVPDPSMVALFNTALGHSRAGRHAEGEAAYRSLLALDPAHAGAAYNLAVTLATLGRREEAAAWYRQAIRLRPGDAKAHNNLGGILADLGETEAAADHYARALALQPGYANAHYNLANLLRGRGDLGPAIAHYRQALAARPDDADAHNNLGLALAADGQPPAAIVHFRRALALRPEDADALNNLGSALVDAGRPGDGKACYAQALALKPDFADAHNNLGAAFAAEQDTQAAIAHFRQALALRPDDADMLNNLGAALLEDGRAEAARDACARAAALKPDFAEAHWNEGLARLVLGDFAGGWPKYEWRWRRDPPPRDAIAAPAWDGAALPGGTILLRAEQGQGDVIQFVRYAPWVKARAGEVVLEAPAALHRLLAGAPGVDRLVDVSDAPPACDAHAPLLSLPRLSGATLETIPADAPYLQADESAVRDWRARLAALARPKVGLAWRGNPAHRNDRRRSIAAQAMTPLTRTADAGWVSLQHGASAAELAALCAPMLDAQGELGDWADTAALVQALDLVVTVDTAVAHLAGALGKPVWVLLPFAPDWRWLLRRADSPWYPSMRLYRQPEPGDWASVLDRVRADLGDFRAANA